MEDNQQTYERILESCIGQERRAQAAFYDMFAPQIHATACRMLSHTGEAEEVVQEMLLRVLTNTMLLLPEHQSMVHRLRRMTVNACISRLRKRRIVWENLDGLADNSDEEAMDELLLQEERSAQLHRAIASLSQQSRTVLQLAVLEELDYEEIGALLDITASSVRAHVCRAKQKLINYFKNEKR